MDTTPEQRAQIVTSLIDKLAKAIQDGPVANIKNEIDALPAYERAVFIDLSSRRYRQDMKSLAK